MTVQRAWCPLLFTNHKFMHHIQVIEKLFLTIRLKRNIILIIVCLYYIFLTLSSTSHFSPPLGVSKDPSPNRKPIKPMQSCVNGSIRGGSQVKKMKKLGFCGFSRSRSVLKIATHGSL